MTIEQVRAMLIRVLHEDFDVELDAIEGDAHLRYHLGLDSMDVIDFSYLLKGELGFEVKAIEILGVDCFDDLVVRLHQLVQDRTA
jgi:acyl carrier protein